MSSSGLIYAVIVGAWAAYLVPMWLRRQDELNEARPTERFSTAIRLLSGRAAMERRYAKSLDNSEEHVNGGADSDGPEANPASQPAKTPPKTSAVDHVDVRALAVPVKEPKRPKSRKPPKPKSEDRDRDTKPKPEPNPRPKPKRPAAPPTAKTRRAQLLARRRRTTTVLFLAFTAGTIAAAVVGVTLLWVPAIPGTLLTLYIAHLRRQERRRFEVKLDHRRAAEAARRVREQRAKRPAVPEPSTASEPVVPSPQHPVPEPDRDRSHDHESHRALIEETDHAEWVDGLQRDRTDQDGWDPVPVPLPTYVTAPVAPRNTEGVDLTAPDTWSSARSTPLPAETADQKRQPKLRPDTAHRARERGRTPLFDQQAAEDRPRAANE